MDAGRLASNNSVIKQEEMMDVTDVMKYMEIEKPNSSTQTIKKEKENLEYVSMTH